MTDHLGQSVASKRYVCVNCHREGVLPDDFSDDCRQGWTHGRLLRIETTADDALRNDHYDQQLRKLAEVGAALCCYAPGAGDPKAWPKARCDCKHRPLMRSGHGPHHLSGEVTGCAEVRTAWRVVAALKEAANG